MRDNGLLRQYFNQRHQNGFLKVYKKDFSVDPVEEASCRPVFILSQGEKCYYLKDCRDKLSADAEVLLSQVYARTGLGSAIYLPVQGAMEEVSSNIYGLGQTKIAYNKKGVGVISNEVIDEYSCTLDEYSYSNGTSLHIMEFFPERKGEGTFNFKDYFTKDGARDFIKMHLFDVATRNYDRSPNNFFLDVDCDDKISGVRLIDYAAASWPEGDYRFENYLGSKIFSRKYHEMLPQLRDNETVSEVMTPTEMASELETLDFKGVAEDVENTIGYKVDADLVKRLEDRAGQLSYDLNAPEF